MVALASASLSLVAALAWNEAIKTTLVRLGLGDSLAGLYAYAIVATALAVIVLVWLGTLAARVGGEAAITREAEGRAPAEPTPAREGAEAPLPNGSFWPEQVEGPPVKVEARPSLPPCPSPC